MENSLISRWDDRWKLTAIIILTFSLAFPRSFRAMGAGVIVTAILLHASRMPGREIKKAIQPPLSILIFMSPLILLTPGKALLIGWGRFGIYKEGLILLGIIALKSLTIFLLFAVLMGTSGMTRIMHAMKAVGIPEKMVAILISTYRYIFLYRDDLKKLMTAARLRGFSLQKGLAHTLTSADILITLIIRSYEQSQRVNAAMRLRGFTGNYRTMEDFHTKLPDILLFLAVITGSTFILLLELTC